MNLSPEWAAYLRSAGHDARHWSDVGRWDAPDAEFLEWSRRSGAVVLTNDLDFGHELALTHADSPSVIQIRSADLRPGTIGKAVKRAIDLGAASIASGALLTVDGRKVRMRQLPLS